MSRTFCLAPPSSFSFSFFFLCVCLSWYAQEPIAMSDCVRGYHQIVWPSNSHIIVRSAWLDTPPVDTAKFQIDGSTWDCAACMETCASHSIIKMWTRYVTLVTTALFFVRLCVVFLIDFWGFFFLFCFLMVLWDQIRAVFFFSHQLKRNGCNRIFSCLFSLSFSPAVRVCVYVIFDTIQMSSRSLRYQILTVSLTTERKPKQKLHFLFCFFVCFIIIFIF